jgi:hypothetical protein
VRHYGRADVLPTLLPAVAAVQRRACARRSPRSSPSVHLRRGASTESSTYHLQERLGRWAGKGMQLQDLCGYDICYPFLEPELMREQPAARLLAAASRTKDHPRRRHPRTASARGRQCQRLAGDDAVRPQRWPAASQPMRAVRAAICIASAAAMSLPTSPSSTTDRSIAAFIATGCTSYSPPSIRISVRSCARKH